MKLPTHPLFRFASILLCFLAFIVNPSDASGDTAPQWYLVTRNQSALWGWQLLGSHIYNNETAVCNNLDRLTNRRWLGFGVETGYIERVFCDQLGDNQSSWNVWDVAQANILFFNTNTFLSHLIFAFDTSTYHNATISTNPFYHLCTMIRPTLLQPFNIQPDRFQTAICAYSNITNLTPPPTTNTTNSPAPASPSSDAVTVYKEITSKLLGYLLVSASTNFTEADLLCDRTTVAVPSLENTGLTGRVVNEVACGKDGRRLSSEEALVFLRNWKTRAFEHVLENASDDANWADWLCENLDVGAMNQTGLYGLEVQERFCGYAYVDEEDDDDCEGDWTK